MATKDTPEISDVVTTDQTGATVAPASPAQLFPGATPPANPAAPTAGNDAFQPTPGNDPDIPNETNLQRMGVGVDGETTVWEGRYALKNFVGRFTGTVLLTIAWAALAIFAWGSEDHTSLQIPAGLTGVVLALIWLALLRQVILARYGHFYRLTNRRLFVSTGVFRRRRDQMELLRVQDVFTRQSIWDRMLGLGTVVVVSQEDQLPVTYLAGVNDPKGVMDIVWHHARSERDRRTVKVDQV